LKFNAVACAKVAMRTMRRWFAFSLAIHVATAHCPCCPSCSLGFCPDCNGDVVYPEPNPAPNQKPNPGAIPGVPLGKLNVKPLLSCPVNCYGNSSKAVKLPGGRTNHEGMRVKSRENCQAFCMAVEACEAVVYQDGWCYGKRQVNLPSCMPAADKGATTDFITQMPFGECTIMGDPHILSFDNPNGVIGDYTQLHAGAYYLVKGKGIQIEGRFSFTDIFPSAAVLTGIAATGSLIGGHKLVVAAVGPYYGGPDAPLGFKVTWDGAPILTKGIGDKWKDSAWMYAEMGTLNSTMFNWASKYVLGPNQVFLPAMVIQLEPRIRLYLLIGNGTMNAVISMRKLLGNQSGYCGNFNCEPEDDSWDGGDLQPIMYSQSLFSDFPMPATSMQMSGEAPRLQQCTGPGLKLAYEKCRGLIFQWLQECLFDVCASGGSAAVGRADKVAVAVALEIRQKWSLAGALKLLASSPAGILSGMVALVGLSALVVGFGLGKFRRRGEQVRSRVRSRLLVETEDLDGTASEEEVQSLLTCEPVD